MITQYWRVSVDIPQDVWEKYGHTTQYANHSLEVTKGSLAAGSNSYSEVEEWAEYCTEKEAKECEVRMKSMIRFFQEKLKEESDG